MRDVTQWVSRARVLGVQQREESLLQLYHAALLSRTTRGIGQLVGRLLGLHPEYAAGQRSRRDAARTATLQKSAAHQRTASRIRSVSTCQIVPTSRKPASRSAAT